ncbi:MAG TPA: glycoside hydrolase family 18 protein [Candidatus Dormibacteraeota bacterium]|nr:glycoside hydrolase family 18 protein [Candidatus Dormibacteraeota bacterium]
MKLFVRYSLLFLFCAIAAFGQGSRANFNEADHADETTPHKKVVGYFPQWGLYSGYFVKNVITSGSAPLLTHLDYAFANVKNSRCESFDPWADYQVPLTAAEAVNGDADDTKPGTFAGNFHQLQELKRRFPKLKIIMSIGGGSSDPTAFSTAALPQNRELFVKSCVDMFIRGNFAAGLNKPGIFDGFDIDWEFPASAADRKNFTALLAEFREQLDELRPGLSLSIAAPAGSWAYQFIELDKVQEYLNYVGLMTYDYDGPWNFTTGFVAPLYRSLKDPDPSNNANASVEAYLAAGVKAEKLVMGVPFYGYEWNNVPNIDQGLFEPGNPVGGGAPYNFIVTIEKNFQKHRDTIAKVPWLYDGHNFWTYDDPESIAWKMRYVQDHQLAGAMVWELSNDVPSGQLLKTVAAGLKEREDEEEHEEVKFAKFPEKNELSRD